MFLRRAKYLLLCIPLTAMLLACGTKERERLQSKVDSLNTALEESKKAELVMKDIGVILDSIDANREALRSRIVEGMSYAEYVSRLQAINTHIKESKVKVAAMEAELKNAKGASTSTIRRLKNDLDTRSKEIVALQMDVVNLREQNQSMFNKINRQDSILSIKDEQIKLKSADVASLESLVEDINDQNRMKVANLYFAQAQALEVAANRTKFAPRKKKETKREALELYKLSNSLGNPEAQGKIDQLEKEIS